MTALQQDQATWNSGRAAGLAGEPGECPRDVKDRLAWLLGYVEGAAVRVEERRRALEASRLSV
jgi:hypothetical protein